MEQGGFFPIGRMAAVHKLKQLLFGGLEPRKVLAGEFRFGVVVVLADKKVHGQLKHGVLQQTVVPAIQVREERGQGAHHWGHPVPRWVVAVELPGVGQVRYFAAGGVFTRQRQESKQVIGAPAEPPRVRQGNAGQRVQGGRIVLQGGLLPDVRAGEQRRLAEVDELAHADVRGVVLGVPLYQSYPHETTPTMANDENFPLVERLL